MRLYVAGSILNLLCLYLSFYVDHLFDDSFHVFKSYERVFMAKIDTAKHLLALAAKTPGSISKAFSYGIKYGAKGLHEKFREQILLDEVTVPDDAFEPGCMDGTIKFSFIMPTYNVDPALLATAIESVQSQTYSNWELCIVDDCSTDSSVYTTALSYECSNIKVIKLPENSGISVASNAAAEMAVGDYICPIDNDDVVKPNALEELYRRICVTKAAVLYTDNDVIDCDGNAIASFYKPDWSPDLMLSQMYVGHLICFQRKLFNELGGYDTSFDGSQDYDLFLRFMLTGVSIEHIAKVLYSWRAIESSTAMNPESKPYAHVAGRLALQKYVDSKYGNGVVKVNETNNYFVYDIRYPISPDAFASIIIPTKDHVDDLELALKSIISKTDFINYEIIVLNNNSNEARSLEYFSTLNERYNNVKVVDAPYAFNWSRLNNQGAKIARGNVLVFLNNDIEVISSDWLTRLVENCLREDIGVVGGLLTYPDGTIQHAGVVVGMGGWADHVYKGTEPIHYGNPFISPMVTRDVSAVTGACFAVSRDKFELLGGFDDRFIVCGSDVELCLKASKKGFNNLYVPQVRLTHYESKTRDPKAIPEIDFRLSEKMYRDYRISGDPFYNINLDYMKPVPTVLSLRDKMKQEVKDAEYVSIAEIRSIHFELSPVDSLRLNLYIPSLNPEDIFGGISTAIKFFNALVEELKCDSRIIVLDGEPRAEAMKLSFPDYELVSYGCRSDSRHQIVAAVNREFGSLDVRQNDWFIATSWWSAFCHQEELRRLDAYSDSSFKPLIYLIQDYEPGFYSWSSNHILAQTTYRNDLPTIAVFNSSELRNYFVARGYSFEHEFYFEPSLNPKLNQTLSGLGECCPKRKQILVYGRPGTDRNAFSLVIESLRRWVDIYPDHAEWSLLSAGESHPPMYLNKGQYLVSVGKQTLEGYAQLLSESYAGLSLMVSPHPSYPPLEMASFGVQTITNSYVGKDLSYFADCIHSVDSPTPFEIAAELKSICLGFKPVVPVGDVESRYLSNKAPFPFINELSSLIKG